MTTEGWNRRESARGAAAITVKCNGNLIKRDDHSCHASATRSFWGRRRGSWGHARPTLGTLERWGSATLGLAPREERRRWCCSCRDGLGMLVPGGKEECPTRGGRGEGLGTRGGGAEREGGLANQWIAELRACCRSAEGNNE